MFRELPKFISLISKKPEEVIKRNLPVCRKPQNFSFILSNVVVDIVKVRINAIRFIFFEADVRTF